MKIIYSYVLLLLALSSAQGIGVIHRKLCAWGVFSCSSPSQSPIVIPITASTSPTSGAPTIVSTITTSPTAPAASTANATTAATTPTSGTAATSPTTPTVATTATGRAYYPEPSEEIGARARRVRVIDLNRRRRRNNRRPSLRLGRANDAADEQKSVGERALRVRVIDTNRRRRRNNRRRG